MSLNSFHWIILHFLRAPAGDAVRKDLSSPRRKEGGQESRAQEEDSRVFCCVLLSVVLKAASSPPSDHSCRYNLHIVPAAVTHRC